MRPTCFLKPDIDYVYLFFFSLGFTLQLEHRHRLIKYNTFLIDNMECTTRTQLLDNLLQSGVLNQQELEEINVVKVGSNKNRLLLEYIKRSSRAQYDRFLKCLTRSHQQYIVDTLSLGMQFYRF